MEQTKRACPECSKKDNVFRGRKIVANLEKGEPEQWETKRACRLADTSGRNGSRWRKRVVGGA
jgi:hypothetical protein